MPYVYVNFTFDLNSPSASNLTAIGGHIEFQDKGVKGIIVYRKSNDEYVAWDKNCTYQPRNACATIRVDVNGITATDTCCGSTFNIADGNPTRGPAGRQLLPYRISFSGSLVRITNYQ